MKEMKDPATEEEDPGAEDPVDIIVEEWEVREDLLRRHSSLITKIRQI